MAGLENDYLSDTQPPRHDVGGREGLIKFIRKSCGADSNASCRGADRPCGVVVCAFCLMSSNRSDGPRASHIGNAGAWLPDLAAFYYATRRLRNQCSLGSSGTTFLEILRIPLDSSFHALTSAAS